MMAPPTTGLGPAALLLALDSATDTPTVAVGTAADPSADTVIPHRHDLSRDLDGVVRMLLSGRHVAMAALAGIVVADGPGSFTGLRIGIAFAKGLARALDIPLLSAPSLLGAARTAAAAGLVVAEYDALRGDVYRAAYEFTPAGVATVAGPALVPRTTALPPAVTARAGAEHASAAALLRLTAIPGGTRAIADPAGWEPDYGRPAEAEARLQARRAHR